AEDGIRDKLVTGVQTCALPIFVQKLPAATGPSINENINNFGDGRTEIDLRGMFAKETLVLQDGRRLASDGFAGYTVDLNFFFNRSEERRVGKECRSRW